MIWASVITAVAAVAAAVVGTLNHRKIDQVHVLVNSRLDTALAQIEDLKQQRDIKHDEAMEGLAAGDDETQPGPRR